MSKLIPAILTDSLDELKAKLDRLAGLTDWVQIDIMDGLFVPQTSISLEQLASLKADFSFDIHLMVNNPEGYIGGCRQANAKRVIFQLEGVRDPESLLDQLAGLPFETGIALRPQTPLGAVEPYLDRIDTVLLLSVEPGKQGQTFIPETFEKIARLRQIAPQITIEVDGGVNAENIGAVASAGADRIVVGSAIMNAPDMAVTIEDLNAKIKVS